MWGNSKVSGKATARPSGRAAAVSLTESGVGPLPGDRRRTRTCNQGIKSPLLCHIELAGHGNGIILRTRGLSSTMLAEGPKGCAPEQGQIKKGLNALTPLPGQVGGEGRRTPSSQSRSTPGPKEVVDTSTRLCYSSRDNCIRPRRRCPKPGCEGLKGGRPVKVRRCPATVATAARSRPLEPGYPPSPASHNLFAERGWRYGGW